jgi:hypothetical protein
MSREAEYRWMEGEAMKTQVRKIVVDEHTTVSSVWAAPEDFRAGEADALILGHGAGNDMTHPLLSYVHETLAEAGFLTVKFNFPYKEHGRKVPDPQAKLERTFRQLVYNVRDDKTLKPRRLFIGGRSLGGRIASHLAAQGELIAGLVFLGYPLHPPNQPEKLRTAHLAHISCPMLFITGSKDPFCQLALLKKTLRTLKAPTELHVIEEGDHSFRVPKRSGRTEQEIWQEIISVILAWTRKIKLE